MSYEPLYTPTELAETRRRDAQLANYLEVIGDGLIGAIAVALIAFLFAGGGPFIGLVILMILVGAGLIKGIDYIETH